MTDEQLKHMDYLQSAIDRMATNQFQIKGWMITIDTAVLTLFVNAYISNPASTIKLFFLIMLFPTLAFWLIDSKFLSMERSIREVYSAVVQGREDVVPFEIMPKGRAVSEKAKLIHCMFSFTNTLIYFCPTIMFVLIYLLFSL